MLLSDPPPVATARQKSQLRIRLSKLMRFLNSHSHHSEAHAQDAIFTCKRPRGRRAAEASEGCVRYALSPRSAAPPSPGPNSGAGQSRVVYLGIISPSVIDFVEEAPGPSPRLRAHLDIWGGVGDAAPIKRRAAAAKRAL